MLVETAYIGALLFAGALALGVAAWLHAADLGLEAKVFTAFMAIHPILAVLLVAELLAPAGSDLAVALYGLENAVGLPIIPLWIAFAALYTDRRRLLSRPLIAAMAAWVVVTGVLMLTNPLHGLLWSSFEVVQWPFPYLEPAATPLFSVLTLPQPLLNLVAMGLLAHRFLFGSGVTRSQTLALFVGFLPPWFVFGAWGAGVLPGPLNGWFVIGSTWSFVLVGWAIYRYQLFDLVPLARETVFEELEDPVIVVDADDRFVDANRAAIAEFPELEGGQGEPLASRVPAIAEPDGTIATEFTRIAPRGLREYVVSVSPIAAGGRRRGHGLVVRDVTQRERHVRDLERQTEQLERFASTLSHDLRNPLNVAQARVKNAIRTDAVDGLASADEALSRIDRMIRDLLSLAREGRTIDETERVRLADVFRDAWETTDTRDSTSAVDPEADVDVFADRARLQNVFENLIRNAVTHGGPTVTVTLGRHDGGFYVEDDGPGVPPGDRATVFAFEFTTDEAGTGLGLAIVDAIAGAHGWTVEMTEGSQGGARVVFSDVDMIERSTRRQEPAQPA